MDHIRRVWECLLFPRRRQIMSQRVQDLVERLKAFNREVIKFVENCSENHWNKVCAEEWNIGVVARHIGVGHYNTGAADMAKSIVDDEKVSELTMEQIVEMANTHAREHVDCSRAEVLDLLNSNGAALADFVAGLDDVVLDRSAHMELVGGEVSAQRLIELVIFESGGEHLANMKKALAT
jgi:hypothetical protein